MGNTVRSISVELSAKLGNYVSNMKQAGQATKQLGGELETLSVTSKEKFGQVTNFALGAGAALLGFAAYAVKAGYTFDKTMSQVAAVSDATAQQQGQLRDAAIAAGKATIFSASQAAQGEAELEKAGVSTASVLKGGLTGALSLAAAGQISVADAATDTAQALNIFALQGTAASHVADVLSAGANKSATDVAHLSDSLNQSGLVAHQTGLTLEQTVGTLSLFAQNGLVGSDAGTSFKTMLQALQAPSEKSASLMQALGISAYDAQGKFVGIDAVAQNLHDSLQNLTQADRDNALAQIFGSDAVRSATILYNNGAAGVQKWTDAVDDSGAAAKNAKTQMNNLAGDVEQLKGSIETLAIEGSGGATKGLRVLTEGATTAVNKLIDLPPAVSEVATVTTGLLGVLTLAGTGFVKARGAAKQFLDTLSDMGPAGAKASSVLGKVGGFVGKATLWGVAAYAAYQGVHTLFEYLNKNAGPTTRNVDALTSSLAKFADTGQVTGELKKTFGANLQGLNTDLTALLTADAKIKALQNPTTGSMIGAGGKGGSGGEENPAIVALEKAKAQATEDFSATDASLAKLTSGGGSAQALTFFQTLTLQLEAQGKSFADINKLFPKYNKAAGDAAAANSGLAQGFGTANSNAATLVMNMTDLIEKGQTFDSVWKSLNGALMGTAQAKLAANQAIEDLTKTFKANKDAIKGNSDAALEDNIAVGNVAENAAKAADATYQQTGSVDAANKVYATYIDSLKEALKKLGLTPAAIDEVIGQYADMPTSVTTDIKTPGIDTAKTKVQSLHDLIYDIPASVSTSVNVKVNTGQLNHVLNQLHNLPGGGNRWGGVYQHAAIGLVSAGVYSPQSPARYAFAEPQTGGEAFVPKYGNYARSTSIIDTAARWYGGRFAPNGGYGGGGGGSSSTSTSATYNVYPQRMNMTVQDLAAMSARHDAQMRVGRRQ